MARRLRYAFGITSGTNAGLGCRGWRIWTHADSLYIGAKGNPWKASLHADASWRVAVTSEHVRLSREPIVSGGRATAWEFEPTTFDQGSRMVFVIAVTRDSLMRGQFDPRETVIEVADRWDQLTLLYLWMTEANVDLQGHIIGGPLPLSSGRRVWVTSGVEAVDPSEPQPMPAGQVILPRSPSEHGVASPGFLVGGLNMA